jgi:hypothetical protein
MLPKIEYPLYNIKIPSLKKVVKFRPFLVKEEKLLLMARESENQGEILGAIKQIVNNCCTEDKFDVNKLAVFDLEYIFLKLRAFSVDNIAKLTYKDYEDEQSYDFNVDLNNIEVVFPKDLDTNIKITDKSGIIMKYPPATLYDDEEFLKLDKNYMFELIIRCIDKIYYEDNIYEVKNYKKQEIESFLENLNMKTFDDIQNFLISAPKLEYEIKYTNKLGNERKIVLNSLNDFFSWR